MFFDRTTLANQFLSEGGRHGRYGRGTAGKRQHLNVRIKWNAFRTVKSKHPSQKQMHFIVAA